MGPTSVLLTWNISRWSGWQPRGLRLTYRRTSNNQDTVPAQSVDLSSKDTRVLLEHLDAVSEYEVCLCARSGSRADCKTAVVGVRGALHGRFFSRIMLIRRWEIFLPNLCRERRGKGRKHTGNQNVYTFQSFLLFSSFLLSYCSV